MDGIRDLARDELWVESLERSRARREAAEAPRQPRRSRRPRREAADAASWTRREVVPASPRQAREVASAARPPVREVAPAPRLPVREVAPAPRLARGMPLSPGSGSGRRIVPAAAATLLLVLLAVVLSGTFGGSSRTAHLAARAQIVRPEQGGPTYPSSGGAAPISGRVLSGRGPVSPPPKCQAVVGSSNYFNPLAASKVTPERIDQGVDYAGTGALGAIGAARITYVATQGTGWPGAFIEYRLLDGTDAGCYVFYAEGVKPAPGLRVGQIVGPGQPVATLIPGWSTGIELGWGAGFSTVTYAAAKHQWSAHSDAHSEATPAGKSFSALIHALGGTPGKLEG